MQLFDRLIHHITNRKPKTATVPTTVTTNEDGKRRRKFSLRKYYNKRKEDKKATIHDSFTVDQELLLTQCIETALNSNNNNNNNNNSNYTVHKRTISFQEPSLSKQQKQRKLSLPPQLNKNLGYLASIPEVDSQVALNL